VKILLKIHSWFNLKNFHYGPISQKKRPINYFQNYIFVFMWEEVPNRFQQKVEMGYFKNKISVWKSIKYFQTKPHLILGNEQQKIIMRMYQPQRLFTSTMYHNFSHNNFLWENFIQTFFEPSLKELFVIRNELLTFHLIHLICCIWCDISFWKFIKTWTTFFTIFPFISSWKP
jgi:hypothetical protein